MALGGVLAGAISYRPEKDGLPLRTVIVVLHPV
ncbi:hypothetical protein GGR71_002063 [Xanthomonas sp. F1]